MIPDVRKLIRRVVLAFGITLVVSAIGTIAIGHASGNGDSLARSLLLAFTPAFFAASIACWTTIIPVSGGERDIFGADQVLHKKVIGVVMNRSSHRLVDGIETTEQLTAPQRMLAARFASIQTVSAPFQVGQGLFALIAMMFFAASHLVDGQDEFDAAYVFTLAFGAVTIAAVLPFAHCRWRTIKQYRDDHQDDLVDAT